MSDRLQSLISQIDGSLPDDIIIQWLRSTDNDRKLLAVLTIRRKVENERTHASLYYDTAKALLSDNDSDSKWQSFIIVGHFLETKPSECWQLIIEHGDSDDPDTRAAVATILLEHYFEKNAKLFDAKFKEYKQLIKAGQKNLLRTLCMCTSDWGSEKNHTTVNRFLETQRCSV